MATIELTLEQCDELVNMFNQPLGVPTVTWAKYIDIFQRQVGPQAAQMKSNINAIKTATEKMDE